MKLIAPLGLNPKMTFADLNAGAGGAARAISESAGIWVTAMEPNGVLAAHGMEESSMAGLGKKAPIVAYDPEASELRPNGFDCVFVKELFFTVVNKRRLITEISKSLKKSGQLLFTDYLLAKTGNMEDSTQNWMAHEPVRPEMWSIKQAHDYVEKQGLEIRIEDDMTQEMCGLILRGWRQALPNFRPGHFEPELGDALLAEAELWARRLTVLLSGDVRVYRIHAFKK
jgi:ubiquinone/menaquinone biosynthesis C-methylase UbiE